MLISFVGISTVYNFAPAYADCFIFFPGFIYDASLDTAGTAPPYVYEGDIALTHRYECDWWGGCPEEHPKVPLYVYVNTGWDAGGIFSHTDTSYLVGTHEYTTDFGKYGYFNGVLLWMGIGAYVNLDNSESLFTLHPPWQARSPNGQHWLIANGNELITWMYDYHMTIDELLGWVYTHKSNWQVDNSRDSSPLHYWRGIGDGPTIPFHKLIVVVRQ